MSGYYKTTINRDRFKDFLSPFKTVCKTNDPLQITLDGKGMTAVMFGADKVSAVKAVLDAPSETDCEEFTVLIPMLKVLDALKPFGTRVCIEITDDGMGIADVDCTEYEYSRGFRLDAYDGKPQRMPQLDGMEMVLGTEMVSRICSVCETGDAVHIEWDPMSVKFSSEKDALTTACYRIPLPSGEGSGHVCISSAHLTSHLKACPTGLVKVKLEKDRPLTILYSTSAVSGQVIIAPRREEEEE